MKRLDDILKRCEAAPRGPLEIIGLKDAPVEAVEFYAHARTDLPLVVEALQKALRALNITYAKVDSSFIKVLSQPSSIKLYLQLTVEELMHRRKYALKCIAEIEALLGNGK